MIQLPSHMLSRILIPAPVFAIGVFEVAQGSAARQVGRSLCGLAIALIAVNAFLQPLLFKRPLSGLLLASQAAAIGPTSVRTALPFVAIGLMSVGLFIKYVLEA
jgi:hypothetical protein